MEKNKALTGTVIPVVWRGTEGEVKAPQGRDWWQYDSENGWNSLIGASTLATKPLPTKCMTMINWLNA